METRRAYNLREVLLVYNFSLVLLSAWMTYEVSAAEVSVLTVFDFYSLPLRCHGMFLHFS